MKKRLAALLVTGMMAVGMLGGCGSSFDASGYTKAYLDTTFKNDSTEFVKQSYGTKEDAEKLYTDNLDGMVEEAFGSVGLSDETIDGYKESFRTLFGKVKYTVGDSEKKDDAYEVSVKYEKLNVFASCMESYQAKMSEWSESMSEEDLGAMDQSEIMEKTFQMLKDSLDDALSNASYDDEATTTITITKNSSGQYELGESEAEKLCSQLIDLDALQQQ